MPSAATWMQLEIIILSEINQNGKPPPHDIISMWNLKDNAEKPVRQKQTHGHREQTCGCQWGGRWGKDKGGAWG